MSERILVTGSSGFTGVHLISRLIEQGHDVVTLRSRPHQLTVPVDGVTNLIGDICDAQRMQEVAEEAAATVVIHLAGEAQPSSPKLANMLDLNILGPKNLLDGMAKLEVPPRRIILASSSNVYGDHPVEAMKESLCPKPTSVYGCSKLSMENLARPYSEFFDVLVVRPFNYTGRGQPKKFAVPKIVLHFKDTKPIIRMGKVSNARDFSDVRDVIEIYNRLITAPLAKPYDVVNLTSGNVHSLADIIDCCKSITGHNIEIAVDLRFIRVHDPKIIRACTERLSKMIGTIPTRPLTETLQWMLSS